MECIIAIIDVRQIANEDFKVKAIKCVADILKEIISTQKKTYVSFVLLGTARTSNDINTTVMNDGYLNIVQYPQLEVPSWQMLIDFYKFMNETVCDDGDWLEALVVSMELARNSKESLKYKRHSILLFHDFNGQPCNYDCFEVITENLVKLGINLVVISQNILYVDDLSTGDPQVLFASLPKSDKQLENEKYALRLRTDCNASLCNFNEARSVIFRTENKRPTLWNSTLRIGTKISIQISGFITIKDENNIKHTKCWGAPGVVASRVEQYFLCDNEIEPLPDDLIGGYMLGATPIAYDESLRNVQRQPGLNFLGFTKRKFILDEYFSGSALYCVVAQKGQEASSKKFDALARALIKSNMVVLCWKVYSAHFNNPKLVVLLPNKFQLNEPSSMSMIELAHHDQHQFWNFPSLRTERSSCTPEQIASIDKLIDAMDLSGGVSEYSKSPRDTSKKDLLPYDDFPHIFEHNVMDVLERKVLSNVSEDQQFREMLEDKNFIDVFWKLPEPIEQNSKSAVNKVKGLFPLERIVVAAASNKTKEINQNIVMPKPELPCVACIGSESPSNDFEQALQLKVICLPDKTLRDAQYSLYADQMRSAIWKLIFETDQMQLKKLSKALSVYRKSCYDFNAIDDYNKWIREIKSGVLAKGLTTFWKAVIVEDKLGLCGFGKPSFEDELALDEFYGLENDRSLCLTQNVEMNDTSIDKWLANI